MTWLVTQPIVTIRLSSHNTSRSSPRATKQRPTCHGGDLPLAPRSLRCPPARRSVALRRLLYRQPNSLVSFLVSHSQDSDTAKPQHAIVVDAAGQNGESSFLKTLQTTYHDEIHRKVKRSRLGLGSLYTQTAYVRCRCEQTPVVIRLDTHQSRR